MAQDETTEDSGVTTGVTPSAHGVTIQASGVTVGAPSVTDGVTVRPAAWRWGVEKLRGCEYRYSLFQTRPEAEPLYTRLALKAVAAAEHERIAAWLEQQDDKHEQPRPRELAERLRAGEPK